jgi:hypothetical protein
MHSLVEASDSLILPQFPQGLEDPKGLETFSSCLQSKQQMVQQVSY